MTSGGEASRGTGDNCPTCGLPLFGGYGCVCGWAEGAAAAKPASGPAEEKGKTDLKVEVGKEEFTPQHPYPDVYYDEDGSLDEDPEDSDEWQEDDDYGWMDPGEP